MKKVLEIIINRFIAGGAQAFIVNSLDHMDKSDLKIDLFCPYDFDFSHYENKKDIFNKIHYNYVPFNEKTVIIDFIKPLNNLLKSEKYDVVHIHSGRITALAISSMIAKLNHVEKIIVHSHSSGIKNFKHYVVKTLSLPLMRLCPTDYFACSKPAAEIKFSKKIIKNKVVYINNGIDLDIFKIDNEVRNAYRQKLGYAEENKVIGQIGRFSREKNHRFIIDLFAELSKESDNYRLLLLGDGELKSEIEDYAIKKGVCDNIIFTGNVINPQDYLQAMDLFILPSFFEGLPLVGVEAQACGLPVIFSDAVTEQTKLTENVRFLSLNDIDGWKNEVENMINIPKNNNSEIIRSKGYDINQTAKKIKDIYFI